MDSSLSQAGQFRTGCVTVGVARERTLTAQWPKEPSIGQNLQPFAGNSDVSSNKLMIKMKILFLINN